MRGGGIGEEAERLRQTYSLSGEAENIFIFLGFRRRGVRHSLMSMEKSGPLSSRSSLNEWVPYQKALSMEGH